MKIKLNTTRSSRERYYLIGGSMGNYGSPARSANHVYEVVNGIDRGNGYQGYMTVSHAVADESRTPEEVKRKIIEICKKENLTYTS